MKKMGLKKLHQSGGNEITKWEYDIIQKPLERATKRLNKELKALATPKEGEKYSRLQMGSAEANIINKKRHEKQEKKHEIVNEQNDNEQKVYQ